MEHRDREAAVQPETDEQEINLLELVQVVVKFKRQIVRFTVAVAILSVVYSLFLPNIYSATARILPPQKEAGGGLSALLGQMGGLAALAGGFGGSADLYVGILKSRSVADAVIAKVGLAKQVHVKSPDDLRKILEGKVKVKTEKDGIITITADDKDPVKAATLANAFVEELGRRSVELNLSKAGGERAFLEKRLAVVKQELQKAEDALRDFQERYKTIKVDTQAAASIEGIARLRADLASKEVQLASLRSYETDESSDVRTLMAATAKIRSQLAAMTGTEKGSDVIPAVGNVPNLGLEYARRMRDVKIQEAVFEQLTKEYEVAKLNEAKDSSTLQVLDDAVVPARKSKPKRSLIVIVATATAFFVSIFWAFVMEYGERMPAEDRARWQEIQGALGLDRLRGGHLFRLVRKKESKG